MASNDKNKDKKCLKGVNITYKKPEPSSSVTSTAPSVCPQTGDTFPRLEDCIHTSENDHFVNESFPEKADGRAFSESLLALPSLLTILEDCEEEFSPGPVPNSDIRGDTADLEDLDLEVFSSNSFTETGLTRTKSTVDFTQYLETNNNETDKDLDNLKSDNCWFHPINDKDKTDKVLLWPDSGERLAKHASYLFHKDNRTEIARMAELMPKGREFVVFNFFHDIARAFGHRNAKRKHVHFPEEFTQKYEQQGDVAGKDRVVPETPVAYKTSVRPKRKLSAVYTTFSVKSDEFVPRVERVEDTTKCGVVCQRKLEHCCDCCYKSKKPDLTVTLNGFISNLNLISLFIHAHGTRTFEHAMMILEFVTFHDHVGRDSFFKRNSVVWKMNYAKQRFGVLSGAIWIFTFCIRTLIINETKKPSDEPTRLKMLPSESGFRMILEEFASFCLLISENVKAVLQYSQNFHNFCKECERLIRILRFHIEFEATLTYSKPLRRGDGLQLNKSISKTAMGKQKSLELLVKRCKHRSVDRSESPNGLLEAKVDPPPEWKSFSECTGSEKVACLKQLLVLANSGMTTVQTQLRFLLDDIAESAHDVTAQSDLLYLLADMLDRVKYLESFGRKNVKQELETCAANMNDLCKDFQEFINYAEHIIKRFIELRDVTHLCYEFMLTGLKIQSLEEMVPKNTFNRKHVMISKIAEGLNTGDREKKAYKKVSDRHHVKYKPMDFYRTYYHDMVTCKAEITTLKYLYQINPSNKPIEDFVPTLKHLRRYADPTNYLNTIASIDEMEYGDASEDSESDEEGEIRPQPIIKITGSPFASPRGSVDSGNEE